MFDDHVLPRLLRRSSLEPPHWHDSDLSHDWGSHRDQAIQAGWIREITPTAFSERPHCGPGTMGRVRPLTSRQGAVSLWLSCRDCGLVEIPSSALRRWTLDLAVLAGAIARAAGIRGEPESFADRRGWFLGRANWAKRSREVFWLRAVFGPTVTPLRDRLATHRKAVVFVSTPEDARVWRPYSSDQHLIVLDQVMMFAGELRCDVEELERILQPEPVAVKSLRPRSPSRKGELLTKIDRLKSELVAHIRAAKRYAQHQEDATGELELLPRPTKSQLAKQTGLQPYDVTRCFEDDAGRELKVLWAMADDLQQILRFGG